MSNLIVVLACTSNQIWKEFIQILSPFRLKSQQKNGAFVSKDGESCAWDKELQQELDFAKKDCTFLGISSGSRATAILVTCFCQSLLLFL